MSMDSGLNQTRIEEILRESISKAVGENCSDSEWMLLLKHNEGIIGAIEAMKSYARECCIATLEEAAEKASFGPIDKKGILYIDKSTITNPENIKLL